MDKSFLIDVSVLIIFFNRPGCLSKVFEQIKIARPSKLFLYQDGARENNPNDIEGIKKCREIVSDIDWDCEVHTLYQEKNFGCDPSGYIARKWAFEYVDKCIVLEDDCVPSQSLFPFCKELLDKYENDQRINMICCMNNLETWDTPNSYIFTETGSICGIATWKRIIDEWDPSYSFLDDHYDKELLLKYMKSKKPSCINSLSAWKSERATGLEFHEAIGGIAQVANSRLNIVSAKNLISNVGNTPEGGTHSVSDISLLPRNIRKIFTMPAYELEFPLTHPKYIINDVEFQSSLYRLMGTGHPFVRFKMKIARTFLILTKQGFKPLFKKIKNKMGK